MSPFGTFLYVYVVLFGLIFSAGSAHAATVHFPNNDRLTGKIVGMEEGFLILQTDYADKIKINRDKIKTITSDEPLEIRFDSGEIVRGAHNPKRLRYAQI